MMTAKGKASMPTAASTATARWGGACQLSLLAIIGLQWMLLTVLLNARGADQQSASSSASASSSRADQHASAVPLPQKQAIASTRSIPASKAIASDINNATIQTSTSASPPIQFAGVAATVIFRAPRWFHLRYTLMIHNALANLPADWGVHVFYHAPWVHKELLPWHPALRKMLLENDDNPRILATALPDHLLQGKPKNVLADPWFWETCAADRVFLFSGNGAFCGNHDGSVWNTLVETDYCAAPWNRHDGAGGSGATHSYRNRTAMLQVLEYAAKKPPKGDMDVPGLMLKMNKQGLAKFRVATPEQTRRFGGSTNLSIATSLVHMPLAVSGTQAGLSYAERDSLLKHCPEIKAIFPSLHEPACFGAHPVKDTCQATICALREPLPRGGC